MRLATLELQKPDMAFSAGHFTIFSATEREPLHGHNYQVGLVLELLVNDNGMSFDYNTYKEKIRLLCKTVDQTFLLPKHSAYIRFEESGDYLYVHFNQEKIPFLKKDVTLLPVRNITVEELSNWFLQQLLLDKATLKTHGIQAIEIKIYSGIGQWGSTKAAL